MLSRARKTSVLLGHHLRSLATLLFSSHQSEASGWQNQLGLHICVPYGYHWARMYICLHVCVCVCAHQAQIHGFLHTTKGVRERVTVRNYYLQAATTKHILLSCLQYVAETLSAFRQQSIFSGSHYAQLKITSSKYMEHVYKT